MHDPPHPRPPSSQPMRIPFPSSASPYVPRFRATGRREDSTSSGESPRSRSSHGSSDLIFPMDPPTPPERRTRHQSYAGGHNQRSSPPSPALPQALPSLSIRCNYCHRQFTPRSDYAARMRMCDECRVPTRRPAQDAVAVDSRGVPAQRPRHGAPPFQFFTQGTLAPPVVTRTGRHEQYTTGPTLGPAPVAQPSRTRSGVTVIGRGYPAARPGRPDDLLFEGVNPVHLPDAPYYVGSLPPSSTMHRWAPRRR